MVPIPGFPILLTKNNPVSFFKNSSFNSESLYNLNSNAEVDPKLTLYAKDGSFKLNVILLFLTKSMGALIAPIVP